MEKIISYYKPDIDNYEENRNPEEFSEEDFYNFVTRFPEMEDLVRDFYDIPTDWVSPIKAEEEKQVRERQRLDDIQRLFKPWVHRMIDQIEARFTEINKIDIENLVLTILLSKETGIEDKKIYRKIAKNYHPDVATDDSLRIKYEELFKVLNSVLYNTQTQTFSL